MNLDHIREAIKHEEGMQLTPYRCSKGYPTIGYGHKLTDGATSTPISKAVAEDLFEADLLDSILAAQAFVGKEVWETLSDARQHCLVDMAFNMGSSGLEGFKRLRAAILSADYARAAKEIKDSRYWCDVPARASRNYQRMLTGEDE